MSFRPQKGSLTFTLSDKVKIFGNQPQHVPNTNNFNFSWYILNKDNREHSKGYILSLASSREDLLNKKGSVIQKTVNNPSLTLELKSSNNIYWNVKLLRPYGQVTSSPVYKILIHRKNGIVSNVEYSGHEKNKVESTVKPMQSSITQVPVNEKSNFTTSTFEPKGEVASLSYIKKVPKPLPHPPQRSESREPPKPLPKISKEQVVARKLKVVSAGVKQASYIDRKKPVRKVKEPVPAKVSVKRAPRKAPAKPKSPTKTDKLKIIKQSNDKACIKGFSGKTSAQLDPLVEKAKNNLEKLK